MMEKEYTFRQRVKLFESRSRSLKIETLKRHYRTLSKVAALGEDSLPGSAEEVLRMFTLPDDYQKLIEHLGLCSPKTRRIADRSLDLWERMDSRIYTQILTSTFFDEAGKLRSPDIDALFRQFHDTLVEAAHIIKK